MTYRVKLVASAKADIRAAYRWIARRAPAAADAWFDRVHDEILNLATLPERFPVAPEAETLKRELRHMIVGNHRVIYAIEGRTVAVVHVRHGARLPAGRRRHEEE